MGLRDKIRRLEGRIKGDEVVISQRGGTVKRFPRSDLKAAFLNAVERATRGAGEDAPPEHPLLAAVRNSDDPEWSGSLFATDGNLAAPIEDLSE